MTSKDVGAQLKSATLSLQALQNKQVLIIFSQTSKDYTRTAN